MLSKTNIFILTTLVIILFVLGYVYSTQSNPTPTPTPTPVPRCPSTCPNSCDDKGICLEKCNDQLKPADSKDCIHICGKKGWRCKTSCDDNHAIEPDCTDFHCDDSHHQFFCKNDQLHCNNNGDYYEASKHCQCNALFTGNDCKCKKIENCDLYDANCGCEKCSQPYYYGSACENTCKDNQGTIDQHQIYNKTCICMDGFIKNSDGKCLPIDKTCKNGGTFDPNTDKCVCKGQYYGELCEFQGNCKEDSEFTNTFTCDCKKHNNSTCDDTCSTEKTCINGTVFCKTNSCASCSCTCNPGFEMNNNICCESSKKPLVDICKGEQLLCQEDGTWKVIKTSKCQDLFAMNGNSEDAWMKKCMNDICTDTTHYQSLTCDEKTGMSTCISMCPVHAPNIECDNSVLMCDSTTNNEWACVEQQMATGCSSISHSFCPGNNNTECYDCGNNQHELKCPGNLPSQKCIINKRQIQKPASYWIDNNIPIYPTIDNVKCNNGDIPTSLVDFEQMQGYKAFNNPNSYINKDGTLVDKNDPSIKYTYKFNVQDTNDIYCWWKEEDIVAYLGDSGKPLCNGNGKFQLGKAGNYNVKNNSQCVCNPGFVGNNCQYTNSLCRNIGNVDKDGKCTYDVLTVIPYTDFGGYADFIINWINLYKTYSPPYSIDTLKKSLLDMYNKYNTCNKIIDLPKTSLNFINSITDYSPTNLYNVITKIVANEPFNNKYNYDFIDFIIPHSTYNPTITEKDIKINSLNDIVVYSHTNNVYCFIVPKTIIDTLQSLDSKTIQEQLKTITLNQNLLIVSG